MHYAKSFFLYVVEKIGDAITNIADNGKIAWNIIVLVDKIEGDSAGIQGSGYWKGCYLHGSWR